MPRLIPVKLPDRKLLRILFNSIEHHSILSKRQKHKSKFSSKVHKICALFSSSHTVNCIKDNHPLKLSRTIMLFLKGSPFRLFATATIYFDTHAIDFLTLHEESRFQCNSGLACDILDASFAIQKSLLNIRFIVNAPS